MQLSEEKRYRLLVDAIVDYAIYMLDPDGMVSSWNSGAQRSKGYTAEEIIGKHFSSFYLEEDRLAGKPEEGLLRARTEGRFDTEGWRVRKDGTRYWASVVIDPVWDDDGTLVGYAKVTRDMTAQQQGKDLLRKSEEQFRILVQGVADYALYMLDTQGLVSSWNSGAQRIKGYTADEIIGRHFSTFYTPEDRANHEPERAMRISVETGRYEKEGWRVRKDGSTFWAHVILDRILDGEGKHIGFAKITRDITDKRDADMALVEAREALFQSQKLEAVGQLTGGVAHDFNNLLMAILSSLELLDSHCRDDPRALSLLANATAGAQRGAALTQRMLAFARKQELKPTRVDVRELVRGISNLLQRSAGPTVTIDTLFPLHINDVLVDGNQLELALLNLVMNARDSMSEGGRIIIATRPETIQHEPHRTGLPAGHYICLAVSDEGHGMDTQTLQRAMEPFFTTKGVGKGTGLGLSMVHGLAEQSGGRLVMHSAVGRGTTAEIWLPMAPLQVESTMEAAQLPSEPAASVVPSEALTVLVVDDDPLIAMTMNAVLSNMGHQSLEAHSGRRALELLESCGHVDVVITDYAMPGMTGIQFAERVKERWPTLPVILASGFAEVPEDFAIDIFRLPKPYGRAELKRALEQATR
ncbi:hybrid sensor histidine kinase/response regulator [Pinirhizobacter soli]|uniref:hybrid sensor histidine kinase/response regulator n=1 Tax=Pinirhizobacter soli TaxID=2786953 RepID=UPI002029E2E5|nr:PAS domain-containing sensor histidine kinase [Pinirhizobacter soli]